jgi:adenylate kinase family enzyme
LADVRHVPHIELDAFMHHPNWVPSPAEEFRAGVAGAIAAADRDHDGWVVDGNYLHRLGRTVIDQADLVVWLDYPRWLVSARVLRRTAGRLFLRRRLWNGNRERLSAVLSPDPLTNILLWSWTNHAVVRERYTELSAGDQRWLRVRRPRDARRLLDRLRRG